MKLEYELSYYASKCNCLSDLFNAMLNTQLKMVIFAKVNMQASKDREKFLIEVAWQVLNYGISA